MAIERKFIISIIPNPDYEKFLSTESIEEIIKDNFRRSNINVQELITDITQI